MLCVHVAVPITRWINSAHHLGSKALFPISKLNMVIMDSSTTAGGTTVVAGPSSVSGGKQDVRGRSASSDTTTHEMPAKHQPIPNDFVRAADYSLEERPFFVIIGHDGLIGALQKLDKQLTEVKFPLLLVASMALMNMLNSREEIKYYRARNRSAGLAKKSPPVDLASSTTEAFPSS